MTGISSTEPGHAGMTAQHTDFEKKLSALARRITESTGSDCKAMWEAGGLCLHSGKPELRDIGTRLYLRSFGIGYFPKDSEIHSLMTEEDREASKGVRYSPAIQTCYFDERLREFAYNGDDCEYGTADFVKEIAEDPENGTVAAIVFCLETGQGMMPDTDLAAELALYDYERQDGEGDRSAVDKAIEHYRRYGDRY